jgi:hypothetical protein
MTSRQLQRTAGLLLIAISLAFTVCFTLLAQQFEYPDILRQPTGDVLTKFQAGGTGLIAVWYALTLTAVLFIPVVLLLHRVLAAEEAPTILWVATVFGIVAGLVQTLGFLRWPFLVPHLAQAYLAPGAGEAQQVAAVMVFEAFHSYAGMAVGEHLGYLSTSIWTLLVAAVMLRSALFGRWLGVSGIVLALGVATGLLEPAGLELAGTINTYSYLAWAVWLIVVGVVLLVRRPAATAVVHPVALAPQGGLS